jgi:hypothetical protein
MAEDPANRRINGGGPSRYFLQIIPKDRAAYFNYGSGRRRRSLQRFHIVSVSKRAASGEILSFLATGLGPTIPRVPSGQPFPSAPLASVNSPVLVMVNGKPSEVLSAAGFPVSVDGYQVNFQFLRTQLKVHRSLCLRRRGSPVRLSASESNEPPGLATAGYGPVGGPLSRAARCASTQGLSTAVAERPAYPRALVRAGCCASGEECGNSSGFGN